MKKINWENYLEKDERVVWQARNQGWLVQLALLLLGACIWAFWPLSVELFQKGQYRLVGVAFLGPLVGTLCILVGGLALTGGLHVATAVTNRRLLILRFAFWRMPRLREWELSDVRCGKFDRDERVWLPNKNGKLTFRSLALSKKNKIVLVEQLRQLGVPSP